MAKVNWQEKKGVKWTWYAGPCFAKIYHVPVEIRYAACFDASPTKPKVDKWIEFVYAVFGKGRLSHKIKEEPGPDNDPYKSDNYSGLSQGTYIFWTIKSKGMGLTHLMTLLIFLRYPTEQEEYVNYITKLKGRPESLFLSFQKKHIKDQASSGHGLMYCVNDEWVEQGQRCKKSITISQFRKNMRNKKKTSVYHHFVYP